MRFPAGATGSLPFRAVQPFWCTTRCSRRRSTTRSSVGGIRPTTTRCSWRSTRRGSSSCSSNTVRVVEREQVQKVVDEQSLVKGGLIGKETTIKIGKLLGAQHMIMGGFMKDPKDNIRIDARAVNVETGEIEYTERVDDKADNIMTAVANLAGKLNTGMHLPAPVRRTGDATPAPSPAAQQAGTPAAAPTPTTTMPMRVAVLYGKALDQKDKGNKSAAVELFSAVLKEFPNYEPAQREKNSLTNK